MKTEEKEQSQPTEVKVEETQTNQPTEVNAEKKSVKAKKEKKPKELKAPKVKKTTGASIIREAYDKDPSNFDAKKFSEESGISYARVQGCIKKYQVKLEKNKTL
jgi:Mrp family chromosome partitioning ATPase